MKSRGEMGWSMGQSGYQDGKYPPAVPRAIATFSLFSTVPVAIGLGMMFAGGGVGPSVAAWPPRNLSSVTEKKPVVMVAGGAEGKVEGPVVSKPVGEGGLLDTRLHLSELELTVPEGEVIDVPSDGSSMGAFDTFALADTQPVARFQQVVRPSPSDRPLEQIEAKPARERAERRVKRERKGIDLAVVRPVKAAVRLAGATRVALEERLRVVMENDVTAFREGLAKAKLGGPRLGRMEDGLGVETAEFNSRLLRAKKWMRMRVTAYSPDERSCGKWADGYTASGKSVNTNRMKLVAADTRLLPFGTLISVPGYDGGRPVPVLDRGGAIKGHRLDVLYPTHEEALEWGVQYLDVTVWEYVD